MKRSMACKLIVNLTVILAMGFPGGQACGEEAPVLKTQQDRINYSIGVGVARNFLRQKIDVDVDLVIRGMRDGFAGGNLLMSEEDINKTMNAFQTELRQKQIAAMQIAAVENKKAGDAFQAENKKKEGVITLPSGLQYKVLKAGDGKKPTEADKVECRYRGTLLNGAEFDSSERSGQPTVTLEVKALAPGVKEALKLMPAGSKWQVVVPPELAYGSRGSGMEIGPNATLVFEIELIAVK